MHVTIIGTVTAKPETRVELQALLTAQVAPTRAEPGCINYEFHVDSADPCCFVFYENWRTQADLDRHLHRGEEKGSSGFRVESTAGLKNHSCAMPCETNAFFHFFSTALGTQYASVVTMLTIGLLASASDPVTARAADWPQFRGPGSSGVDESRPLPITWNIETGSNILWRTEIPGLGHASPIVWGDKVIVATAVKPGKADLKVGLYGDIKSVVEDEPHQWRLLAVDRASGRILWNTLALETIPKVKRHPKASHCNSTPATDGRRVVAIFGSEGLFCFDLDGRRLWKKDLGPMDSGFFQSPSAQWGFASSPVLHDGKVVVQCDVQTNSFLAVFDAADGRELWRVGRAEVPTWSTPAIIESNGKAQIVVNGWRHTGGYDFATGRELWRLNGGGDIPVPTPIFSRDLDLIFLTSAHGRFRPMMAVRSNATGDITPPEVGATNAAIAWAHARQGNYMQTPILLGGRVWGCSDSGVLTCFDAATGRIEYSERVASGQGFSASPVSDGRNLYVTGELGNVYVVPATGVFSIAATNAMGETCMATPALAGGRMFMRTREKLVAIGAATAKPKSRD